ncbi:MAG TPA: hypothetical protein VLL52_06170 [Anaerolineae bacterium]|nr:hypothetical protein [Anaerolineae bacterium]
MSKQYLREAQIVLWIQWVVLNGLAWGLGLLIMSQLTTTFTPLSLAVVAVFWAGGQWLLLRTYMPITLWGWVMATALGAALGQFIAYLLVSITGYMPAANQTIAILLFGAIQGIIFGLAVGGAQWVVLRQSTRHAHTWVGVTVLGWTIGMSLSPVVQFTMLSLSLLSAVLSAAVIGLWVCRLLDDRDPNSPGYLEQS